MNAQLPPEQRLLEIPAFLKFQHACEFGNLHLSNRSLEFEPIFNRQKEVLIPLEFVMELTLQQDISNFDEILQSLAIDSDVEEQDRTFLLESRGDQNTKPRCISTELLDIFTQNGDYADYFDELLKNGETLSIECHDGRSVVFLSCDFYFHEFVKHCIKFCTKTFNFRNVISAETDYELKADTVVFDNVPDADELIAKTIEDINGLFVRRAVVFRGLYRWCDFLESSGCEQDNTILYEEQAYSNRSPELESHVTESDIYFRLKSPVVRSLCDRADIQSMRQGSPYAESKFNEAILSLLRHMQYDTKDLSQSIERIDSVPIFDQNYSEILDIPELQTLRRDMQIPGKLYVVYSSRQDGAFLHTLYNSFAQQYQKDSIIGLIDTQYKRDRERVTSFMNDSFIILVKTEDCEICGFCGSGFSPKEHSDRCNSVLFALKNEQFEYYEPVIELESYAYADKDFYSVGQEEYALMLDRQLQEVYTAKCTEFDNDFLFSGYARGRGVYENVDVVEVFRFV